MGYGAVNTKYYWHYSMNSSKLIDCIYYASDNESVVCADDTFKLEEGVTYQFLIKLK